MPMAKRYDTEKELLQVFIRFDYTRISYLYILPKSSEELIGQTFAALSKLCQVLCRSQHSKIK